MAGDSPIEVGTATPAAREVSDYWEHACADAWPAVHERRLGDWRLRAADGFTGRANSTLATGSPACPIAAALRAVTEFATEHRIAPRVQVVDGTSNIARIVAAGWVPDTTSATPECVLVLHAPVAALRVSAPLGEIRDTPCEQWWSRCAAGDTLDAAARHVLAAEHAGLRLGFGLIDNAAAVRGALVTNPLDGTPLLYIARLAVDRALRRGGLARGLLSRLGDWAAAHGAHTAVLQVTPDNPGALALYGGLGCTELHRFRYYVPD